MKRILKVPAGFLDYGRVLLLAVSCTAVLRRDEPDGEWRSGCRGRGRRADEGAAAGAAQGDRQGDPRHGRPPVQHGDRGDDGVHERGKEVGRPAAGGAGAAAAAARAFRAAPRGGVLAPLRPRGVADVRGVATGGPCTARRGRGRAAGASQRQDAWQGVGRGRHRAGGGTRARARAAAGAEADRGQGHQKGHLCAGEDHEHHRKVRRSRHCCTPASACNDEPTRRGARAAGMHTALRWSGAHALGAGGGRRFSCHVSHA